jgi:hypothetical protein
MKTVYFEGTYPSDFVFEIILNTPAAAGDFVSPTTTMPFPVIIDSIIISSYQIGTGCTGYVYQIPPNVAIWSDVAIGYGVPFGAILKTNIYLAAGQGVYTKINSNSPSAMKLMCSFHCINVDQRKIGLPEQYGYQVYPKGVFADGFV